MAAMGVKLVRAGSLPSGSGSALRARVEEAPAEIRRQQSLGPLRTVVTPHLLPQFPCYEVSPSFDWSSSGASATRHVHLEEPVLRQGTIHRLKSVDQCWAYGAEDGSFSALEIRERAQHHRNRGATTSDRRDSTNIRVVYKGEEKEVALSPAYSSERVEQEIRRAFEFGSERVICLMDKETGGCVAATSRMPSGTFELITDEEQDIATHLPASALRHHIRPTSTAKEVKKVLDQAGLSKILPELTKCDGQKVLSMPLDYLMDLYGYSGWRRRAARNLHQALHPPVVVSIASGQQQKAVSVASAQDFEKLVTSYECVGLVEVKEERLESDGSCSTSGAAEEPLVGRSDVRKSDGVALVGERPGLEQLSGARVLQKAGKPSIEGLEDRCKLLVIRFEDLVDGRVYEPAFDRDCWASALEACVCQ